MPEIELVTAAIGKPDSKAVSVFWEAVAAGDTFEAHDDATIGDRSVQVSGTFDGATITLQGSNDGVTYVDLLDHLGNAISITADAIVQIGELTRFLKPVITGGTTVDLDVTVVGRRS